MRSSWIKDDKKFQSGMRNFYFNEKLDNFSENMDIKILG